MDFGNALDISAAGMKAQGARLRVIAENVANADATATTPGGDPYRRKTILFESEFDKALGAELVAIKGVQPDKSDFGRDFRPGHPAADAEGYVLTSNVNTLIEMTDMREAQRSYEANLRVMRTVRQMLEQTVSILR